VKRFEIIFLPILFVGIAKAQVYPVATMNIRAVKICNQTWMVKNLDVDHYRNGDKIPEVKDSAKWTKLTTGAWCYYKNDPAYGAVYGKLYNWFAVNDPRGLAPLGWHIPSVTEFKVLTDCLGGDSIAGGKMKESGTTHWNSPNNFATNSSGFTGLPGGSRNFDAIFNVIGDVGVLWSSSYNWTYYLHKYNGKLFKFSDNKRTGFTVRCIKD